MVAAVQITFGLCHDARMRVIQINPQLTHVARDNVPPTIETRDARAWQIGGQQEDESQIELNGLVRRIKNGCWDITTPYWCMVQQRRIHEAVTSLALAIIAARNSTCLLYTSPSPRDLSTSRMPSSA